MFKQKLHMKKIFYLSFFLVLVLDSISQNPQWINFTNGDLIKDIKQEGTFLWICTNGGIVKLNTISDEKIFYNATNSGLSTNYVSKLAISANGEKWIATNYGVMVYDNNNWNLINTLNSGLTSNLITEIFIDNNSNKWIGTDDAGLFVYDGTTWINFNTSNSGLPSNCIRSINIDQFENKWVGTNQGLSKFDGII